MLATRLQSAASNFERPPVVRGSPKGSTSRGLRTLPATKTASRIPGRPSTSAVRCRSAAEALIRRIAREEAVDQRQRLVLDVQPAALASDARAATERIAGDAAVHEREWSAWRTVVDRPVDDSATPSGSGRSVGLDRVPADLAVAERQARLVDDH